MRIATQRYKFVDADIAKATAILRNGGLVAIPTETVYGLAGDARNQVAVLAIFAAKGRPHFNPLIVHVSDIDMARAVAVFDARAEALAARFWPGALTLVLPMRADAGLAPAVTAGLNTVAVRFPAHQAAARLIAAFGGPVAAPSANLSGKVSPTSAAHVVDELDGRIHAILDGGPCDVGVESTIVDLCAAPILLREGGVTLEMLRADLPEMSTPHIIADAVKKPSAPGQLLSHYAPNAPVRLEVQRPESGEIWVGFGPQSMGCAFNLSPMGNVDEAAAQLFDMLRRADLLGQGRATIAVAPIPEIGIGRAINDRLRRAAAPR